MGAPSPRGKALLIMPYFGSFGPWFPLYLQSFAHQHTLDLLLLSDAETPELPSNARRVEMTLAELRKLATAKLGTPVSLHRTRNICDLRPAFGMVFEEFLHGYDYWAFGDEDMLYGDLDKMLAPRLDGTADLVTGRTKTDGFLTVIRNAPRTNELAIGDSAYKDVLASHEHWAYDETSWRWGGEISSFTKIVKEAEARGELLIRWEIPRVHGSTVRRGRWYVYDGLTLHEDNGREILYFHWGRMRRRWVRWPSREEAKNGFVFDSYGFYDPNLGRTQIALRRAEGRVRELAGDARRRLSKWRAAMRATISARRSHGGN